ncbi:MarR family winged helix-turn-helix transcriptional regulator [Citricoccus nitrophenolicus]|uniref:MarR family winged helix-turn-helix transcriptional regulator n=1 Tax=Citricoccus nitrophenolicus TaxID=863575 RepID=UPI0031EA1659
MSENHSTQQLAWAAPQVFRSLAVRRLLSRHGQLWSEQVSAEHTSIQFGLLLCLARSESGLSQTEIAAELSVDKASLTELVGRMTSRGLVVVHRDSRDGRRRVATLTDSGHQLLASLYGPALDVNRRLFAPLTDAEADQLMDLMERALAHGQDPDGQDNLG